jgi:hypothetical protein
MCKNNSVYINKNDARGQVRISDLYKIISIKFQIVINCKMLSNHFSNNINYKARYVIEYFLSEHNYDKRYNSFLAEGTKQKKLNPWGTSIF